LVRDAHGTFYGTTALYGTTMHGGIHDHGVVYRFVR
jgi:hypothetical protein